MSENDWERGLNGLIEEYFQSRDYRETLQRFRIECRAKKTASNESTRTNSERQSQTETAKIISEMLVCLERGDRRGFLSAWTAHVPKRLRETDVTSRQLELKCQMAFAIFPLKNGKNTNSREFSESSQKFKQFLNQRGSSLNDLEGFTTYLAFPYVPDPRTCPDFKAFFSPAWDAELKARVETFLKSAVKSSSKPRLYHLYTSGNSSKVEERDAKSLDRLTKLQNEYQNLLGISVELLAALEEALSGKIMTPDRLESLVARVTGHSVEPKNIDMSRPKTATGFMMASIQAAGIEALKEAPLLPSLNYNNVKSDLKRLPELERVLLLQALRWRLTKSLAGEQRDTVISSYVQHDLLGCDESSAHNDTMSSNLRSKVDLVREYTARLYNTVASLSKGRAYLSQHSNLLTLLNEVLVTEKGDSPCRQNVLGCMQKLSLSRKLQSVMIEQGMIEWLLGVLQDQDSLTEYSLHYAAALLMNLCLRSSGKRRCVNLAGKILRVLLDLIEHDDLEIRSYVNGTLYSLLGEATIREEASAMGMAAYLEGLMTSSEPGLASQLEYIVQQLTSDKPNDDVLSDDEDEDEDIEEDPEELDVDVDESLDPLGFDGNELTGEKLLCEKYLGIMTSSFDVQKPKKKVEQLVVPEAPLQRPTTPKIRSDVIRRGNELAAAEKLEKMPLVLKTRPPPDSRPHTGASRKAVANSRPHSAAAGGSATNLQLSNSRPATGVSKQPSKAKVIKKTSKESLVDGKQPIAPKLSSKAIQKAESQGLSLSEYEQAFGARPKIPRSPDSGGVAFKAPSFVQQERPISAESLPPPPAKSTSPPSRMKLRSSSRPRTRDLKAEDQS